MEVKEGKKEATRILTSFLPLGDMLRRDSTGNGDGGRGKGTFFRRVFRGEGATANFRVIFSLAAR